MANAKEVELNTLIGRYIVWIFKCDWLTRSIFQLDFLFYLKLKFNQFCWPESRLLEAQY